MELNTASGVPIWRQLADVLVGQIESGERAIGDRVPSTRELADQWGVATSTAASALAELRAQGVIKTERGRGSYVASRPRLMRLGTNRYRHDGDPVSPTGSELARQAGEVKLTGLVTVAEAEPHIATRLAVEPGSAVSRVDYRWTDEHGPIQRSTQFEPLAITRGTAIEVPPKTGEPNVISRFASIGHLVTRVLEEVHSRMPTASESDELRMGEGIPVLFISRTHYAGENPVETAEITIRGDRMVIGMEHIVSVSKADEA